MTPELKNQIPLAAIQEALDATAGKHAAKGVAQYHTPPDISVRLAALLPAHRPVLVDLTCGRGDLLAACANASTQHLLGVELTPTRWAPAVATVHQPPHNVIHGGLAAVADLLQRVAFNAPLWVLNPPWGLAWQVEDYAWLQNCDTPAVRAAWKAVQSHGSTIDSVQATLMVALAQSEYRSEGFLIGNDATLQRHLLDPASPYAPLARHIWLRLRPDDPALIAAQPALAAALRQFQGAGVVYFSASHEHGVQTPDAGDYALWGSVMRLHHLGAQAEPWSNTFPASSLSDWQAVREEQAARQQAARSDWNIWLEDGVIRTRLSVFDDRTVDAELALGLHGLADQRPMQLVLQAASRKALHTAAFGDIWRVSPELQQAVASAIAAYQSERAPLVPLNPVQRLGYLDELTGEGLPCHTDIGPFRAGRSYQVQSKLVTVVRCGTKPNYQGDLEDCEYSGRELALWLYGMGDDPANACFMDARIKTDAATICEGGRLDFTLQDLVTHFTVPEVHDMATLYPERFNAARHSLHELESCIRTC